MTKFPLIIAHRGAPGRWQENTLGGFLDGIARGAEWIELDVHLTADNQVVVFHDFRLGGRPLARSTLPKAKQRARQARGIELPTLEEVLAAVPARIGLNIEIKAPGIGRAVVSTLSRHGAVERAICSSFDFPTVCELAELKPRVRSGLLASRRLRDPAGHLRRARASALFQEYRQVDRRSVEAVQQAGGGFFVWTVNREKDLARMIELGVDGIITDYPERLLKLRQEKQ